MFEDAAQSGSFGQTAETMMTTGARTKTDEALQANIPAITSTLANRSPVVTEVGQAGEVAQDVLVAQRNEAQDIADKLYETARGSACICGSRRFFSNGKNSDKQIVRRI